MSKPKIEKSNKSTNFVKYTVTVQVDNCNQLSKPRRVKPNFATDEPVCPIGQLQCGNGQ